ncbi:hypothetical protein HMI54_003033 [Coelomomyces lativittatus]|nr:hypothetical protein HMI56_002559 [Coelomomyces lativittatus]KAJ1517038.1 hypothetical protein HMI55_000790 [Coelomomyces lativittatus]KAJ1518011.1 hypothetical protein HMI54_003033 [Coelomomyces lativittatus]
MFQKLWVEHKTTQKILIDFVPISNSNYVSEFIEIIRSRPQLAIPHNSIITLFKYDGTTEIDVGDSPTSLITGNSRTHPLLIKTTMEIRTLPLNPGLTLKNSPLIGKVLSVSINQSKLIRKYLTPVGSSPATPIENSATPIDLSSLSLQLESAIFYKSTTLRPCIVIDVQHRIEQPLPEEPPPITIVLITGFDGKPLNEVMSEDELKRVMPIYPTVVQPKTASVIHTIPEWGSQENPKGKIPSYVLCIPIKVYPQNLHFIETEVKVDYQNLQMLKLHILALGRINANADFKDLEENDSDSNDSDDDIEVSYQDVNRIISWDEITVQY